MTLIAIAGWVDAVGYLRLGHLFVSFMSGNTTELAIAMAHGTGPAALRAGAVVTLFVLGVFAGRLIALRAGRHSRRVILISEAVLLGIAAILPPPSFRNVIPIVVAMGLQNAAWHQPGSIKTSRTYVTGALVSLGEALADAWCGRRFGWVPHAAMWLAMVAGAIGGAGTYAAIGLFALALPAGVALALGLALPPDT